jgi:hypothetical protein
MNGSLEYHSMLWITVAVTFMSSILGHVTYFRLLAELCPLGLQYLDSLPHSIAFIQHV